MSKNLNFDRLGKLVRWTTVTDRSNIIRSFWMYLALLCIILQLDNLRFVLNSGVRIGFTYGCVIAMIVGLLAGGGSYFFNSFNQWKDGIRELCLLPASRLEKFLVRYLFSWGVQIVSFTVSLLIADVLQYIVGFVLGREPLFWVTSRVIETMNIVNWDGKTIFVVIALMAWSNTLFLLGSNFFRSLKYSFVYTGLVLTALFIGFLLLLPSGSYQTGFTLGSMVKQHGIVIGCIGILLSIANVMAAYRLFGHRPLIGRFINPL